MILERIESPADLKGLSTQELGILAEEIREFLVRSVSETGGHLASSLGVVELTIALHRIYDSPTDKIIWDVGHQCYPHKLLTGRREAFGTLRQYGGLSGFTARGESPHDPFGAGHAGTSVSAALGMALARDLAGGKNEVIAVIGDGSLGAGMALEAINHAGHAGSKVTVILNDNGMSISPSVGAVSRLLNQVKFNRRYGEAKNRLQRMLSHLPLGTFTWKWGERVKSRVEAVWLPNVFWEQLGFSYLGPVDGHNFAELEAALIRARDFENRPTLVHVLTKKGKGHAPAEENASKFHGVAPNGSKKGAAPSYSAFFGETLKQLMTENERIVVITAAMLDGTGLAPVAAAYPDRVLDVGICEQHAVTLAAGLAAEGFVPVVAIYSTFLQRAYDQIIHDVCLQNLPVIFAVDRAGIVGDDGKTHQGSFDISFLRSVPDLVVAAPRDENDFKNLLATAVRAGRPMALRYPRGAARGVTCEANPRPLAIGQGELLRGGRDAAILAIGTTVYPALAAAEALTEEGIDCAVADARFAKPLDAELIEELAATGRLLTVEENTLAGGFGSAVLELAAARGLGDARIACLGLPDRFIEHGSQDLLRSMLSLDAEGIATKLKGAFPELLTPTRR